MLAIVVAGLVAIPVAGSPNYRAYSLFYDQFARVEPLPLALVAAFMAFVLRRVTRASGERTNGPLTFEMPGKWLALAVFAVVWIGVRFVFHSYPFTDDEYSAYFQAQIFARGRFAAAIPPSWCSWSGAITPASIISSGCEWRLSFLPLHSLFRAPLVALGVDQIGGPLTAALSLLLVVSIARKLWPERPERAALAGLFFATSTQLLFMSMTFFSMPTHLLFSLAWLWLYVDNRPVSVVLLPLVGVLALGVHSPFPHGYFALPFLVRYLRDRRWIVVAYVGAVYVLGLLYWHGYINAVNTSTAAPTTLAPVAETASVARYLFSWPGPELQLAAVLHLALAVTWNSPIVVMLAVAAMVSWSRLDRFSRDAAAGIVLVLLARVFLSHSPQGVGWGYRLMHDQLGTLALLAVSGAAILTESIGRVSARRLIVASVAGTVLFQIPARAVNVEQIIGPYRRASDWLASLPEDAVVLPTQIVRWGKPLIRNDPFFREKPVILDATSLRRSSIDSLRSSGRSIRVLTKADLEARGLPMRPFTVGNIQLGY